ncbi:phosphoribosylglycinamide formyltransferase [Pelagibacterium sp. 26DY04]|uniref:phosphoribosylglycinamide formyltransferase n=1 Tax=Pelagibacterium sp. 26DY04 TaxID=2967130 RepID=UPI0028152E58|nr:phosphoribosylglycinamide formyltransferase [Pelagibacterium sp. 26DY04]WMT85332.1 phosphoribosylglycinamide formyltransferase [Pelagibacterium sp. 26DY04]
MTAKKRVAILISGRGSNMTALINAAKSPDYPAEIIGVFSNRVAAPGLDVARAEGIPTATLAQSSFASRLAFDEALTGILEGWDTDIVCMAGFMRILTPEFTNRWLGRAINIHPSLLPAYKGLDTHARALADGVTEAGCTVHFVTPGLDEGPAILQARVPVHPGDTPDDLAARVLVEEHRLYPEALRLLASGQVAYPQ